MLRFMSLSFIHPGVDADKIEYALRMFNQSTLELEFGGALPKRLFDAVLTGYLK